MDNMVKFDKSGIWDESDVRVIADETGITVIDGQNYITRGECGEGCDCREELISDFWSEEDEEEFLRIVDEARKAHNPGE